MANSVNELLRRICCLDKRKEELEEQTNLQVHIIQKLNVENQGLRGACSAAQADNSLLVQRSDALTEQAKAARDAATQAIENANLLSETKRKQEEWNTLSSKLYIEKQWGEAMSPGRPLLIAAGTAAAGPIGFVVTLFVGYAAELYTNRHKHFNKTYFQDLFQMQKKAQKIAADLGIAYPQDLKEAWWNKQQSLISGFLGRDFGFQHRYQP